MFIHSLIIHLVTWLRNNVTIIGCEFLSLVFKATWTLSTFPSPLTMSLSHPAIMLRCSCLHILYSWPQIPVFFSALWVTVNFVESWKEDNNDKNTKCTKPPQPLLLRVQLEPSLNALLVGLDFPKLSHPGGCWRFGGDSCVTEPFWGDGTLFKGIKKTFSGFFYPEDLRGLLSMNCRSSKCVFKNVLFNNGTA